MTRLIAPALPLLRLLTVPGGPALLRLVSAFDAIAIPSTWEAATWETLTW